MSIWSNPLQRFGMIHVNILIGSGVLPTDRDLFFGPVRPSDLFVEEPNEHITLSQLLAKLGVFDSAKDAERSGFKGAIPAGFSDYMRVKKMHRVTILKIAESA